MYLGLLDELLNSGKIFQYAKINRTNSTCYFIIIIIIGHSQDVEPLVTCEEQKQCSPKHQTNSFQFASSVLLGAYLMKQYYKEISAPTYNTDILKLMWYGLLLEICILSFSTQIKIFVYRYFQVFLSDFNHGTHLCSHETVEGILSERQIYDGFMCCFHINFDEMQLALDAISA